MRKTIPVLVPDIIGARFKCGPTRSSLRSGAPRRDASLSIAITRLRAARPTRTLFSAVDARSAGDRVNGP